MIKKLLTFTVTILYSTITLASSGGGYKYNKYNKSSINSDNLRIEGSNSSSLNSSRCKTTPTMKHANKKNELARPTNNLYQKTGHVDHADGKLILIKGIIYDMDCVPVSNAMVQIWQADSNGNFYSSYKFDNAWQDVSEEYDPNFGYSGAVQTSNIGEFSFVTIKPKSKKWGVVPSIDLRVKHEFHGAINTRIFFDDVNNTRDRYFKKLKPSSSKILVANSRKSSNSNLKEYFIPITYDGIDQYRKY